MCMLVFINTDYILNTINKYKQNDSCFALWSSSNSSLCDSVMYHYCYSVALCH